MVISATSSSFVSRYIEFTVHAFFTSHVDYCNTVLVGNLAQDNRYRCVMNAAARIITNTQ